jgi:hypothetical protein
MSRPQRYLELIKALIEAREKRRKKNSERQRIIRSSRFLMSLKIDKTEA